MQRRLKRSPFWLKGTSSSRVVDIGYHALHDVDAVLCYAIVALPRRGAAAASCFAISPPIRYDTTAQLSHNLSRRELNHWMDDERRLSERGRRAGEKEGSGRDAIP